MKNSLKIILGIVCVVVLVIFILLIRAFLIQANLYSPLDVNEDFIHLETISSDFGEFNIQNGHVFTDYNDYMVNIDNPIIKEEDFNNNNYVFVVISNSDFEFNNMNHEDIGLDYKINNSELTINVIYKQECAESKLEKYVYLLKVDKSVTNVNLKINSEPLVKQDCTGIN